MLKVKCNGKSMLHPWIKFTKQKYLNRLMCLPFQLYALFNLRISEQWVNFVDKSCKQYTKVNQPTGRFDQVIHQPYFLKTSPVLFLMRVKTTTAQAMIHGGKVPPKKFSLFTHPGVSLKTSVIKSVITATPTRIFVTGLIIESCNKTPKGR